MSDNRDWQVDMTLEEILAMEPGRELDKLIGLLNFQGETFTNCLRDNAKLS